MQKPLFFMQPPYLSRNRLSTPKTPLTPLVLQINVAHMKKTDPPPITTQRKTVTLPVEVWAAISEYRFGEHIKAESKAVEHVIVAGLQALKIREGAKNG